MKILLVCTLIGAFGSYGFGQEKKNMSLVQLSVEVTEKRICLGDSVNIITRLRNNNNKTIVIDVNKIGLVKYFDLFINKSKKDPYGGFVLVGPQISPSHYKPNFKILLPKESYVESQKFIFDKVNFIVSQKYSMQIGYEQNEVNKFGNIEVWKGIVNSNELTIFINKCGIK